MALATKENILTYIPQRDPICLVHTIYECSEESVKTGFLVEADHFFINGIKDLLYFRLLNILSRAGVERSGTSVYLYCSL